MRKKKPIRGFIYILMRVFKVRKTDHLSVSKDVEQLELSYTVCVHENGATTSNNYLALS